jgi:hypothetical protein
VGILGGVYKLKLKGSSPQIQRIQPVLVKNFVLNISTWKEDGQKNILT